MADLTEYLDSLDAPLTVGARVRESGDEVAVIGTVQEIVPSDEEVPPKVVVKFDDDRVGTYDLTATYRRLMSHEPYVADCLIVLDAEEVS